jgi:hypothetical protein
MHDGNPMVAELHQCGPQGPVDMVIPNSSEAEACFKMFNKEPAEYLYHVYLCLVLHNFCQEHPMPVVGCRSSHRGTSMHIG